jgi:superfamily I DNA/RNA helicase
MKPTQEQVAIVEAVQQDNDMLKVCAIAGSGKTTTLKMIGEALSEKKCLYIAYNKAMAVEAEARMPSNVECRTMHSIAYEAVGSKYRDKLSRPVGGYKNVGGTSSEIARLLHIKPVFDKREVLVISSNAIGSLVKSCVARYEQSSDKDLGEHHISQSGLRVALKVKSFKDEKAAKLKKQMLPIILTHAKALWKLRTNLKSDVLATHDTYLKLYQLSKPTLKCDVLLLDEAQDCNPCFIDITENNQHNTKVILVGDEFQAIYGWRGAVNAMQNFQCRSLALSQSFRYGKDIAKVAEMVLNNGTKIFPNGDENSGVGVVDTKKPYTILFRTNSELILHAVWLIEEGKHTVRIFADVQDFCKLLTSAIALRAGKMKDVKHDLLIAFDNWQEVKEEAKFSKGDLSRAAKLVDEGKAQDILESLSKHVNSDNAHVTLMTAHKSKGLEAEQVVLAEDFVSAFNEHGVYVGFDDAERNLLYVACTRAKKVLQLNEVVKDLMEFREHGLLDTNTNNKV